MPRGKHNNRRRGSKHYRWNSGTKRSSHGYVKVRVGVVHPLADPNGYAYEHLLVWCAAGNQKPARDEVLHHENEDKSDNRIENLRLEKRTTHSVRHGNGLSDEEVRRIRLEYAQGLRDMPTLAEVYNVPAARVSKIIRGETRKSAGGPISTNNRGKKTDGREHNEFPQPVPQTA